MNETVKTNDVNLDLVNSDAILGINQQDLHNEDLADLGSIFDRDEDFSHETNGQTIAYDSSDKKILVSYDKFPDLIREIQYVFDSTDYTDFLLVKLSANTQLCVGRHHSSGHAGPIQYYIQAPGSVYYYNEEKDAFSTSDEQNYPEDTTVASQYVKVLKELV